MGCKDIRIRKSEVTKTHFLLTLREDMQKEDSFKTWFVLYIFSLTNFA